MPGGPVDKEELKTYPAGHVYTVQEHGWMDATVWSFYVRELLQYEIDAPSVLMLDNFDAHVSQKGLDVVAETTSALVCPLPANSTSICQPLDVGVMGPLKKKITANLVAETCKTSSGVAGPSHSTTPVENCVECGKAETCSCWDDCVCWEECLCGGMCLCIERCVCAPRVAGTRTTGDQEVINRKNQPRATAEEKRRATIERTIKAWDDLTNEVIVRSFEKAIPKYPVVEVYM